MAGWDGATEWTGFVPFESMPSVFNPPEGFLHSANQHVVDDSYPYFLAYDLAYGYRGDRIVEVLSAARDVDTGFVADLQRDSKNLNAEALVPALLGLETDMPTVGDAQHILGEWAKPGEDSYQQRADSAGAALYASVWRNLLSLTFHDEVGAAGRRLSSICLRSRPTSGGTSPRHRRSRNGTRFSRCRSRQR